ncbi:magnesium transporter CorA family protein [Clostridium malenominatum]|uniref:Magnesium transporter CorA family protein n=1 Tax=Clostridium malenominatum TaxID=1539 RepID=A0ABP3UET5_9CLOT
MISIYKTIESSNGYTLEKVENIEPGCWINVVAPSHQELLFISKKTNVPMELLRASLDDEETSRIDMDEDNNILLLLDIPFTEMEDNSLTYDTYPISLIHTEDLLITICLKNSKILLDFTDGKVKSFFTFKRSRFILQILHRIASYYLIYLRQIDKKSVMVEKRLHKSMKNKELIQLLSLEKSLVYFSTSLKSNEITLEKMLKLEIMQKYPEDQNILEDVIIENKQAIEMANIYSNILSGTMDAFASVISNNLNIVMKFLASVTIIMSIPNMISGMFGMNVNAIPFSDSPFGFWIVLGLIVGTSVLTTIILNKKDMF